MYHTDHHNLNDHKGNKKQKMHLQERPLLVPRIRFVIKTVICNNVRQRKDAGSQVQGREDAQSLIPEGL